MSHHNFGIYEPECEYDQTLHETVADLRNPPRVPHVHPPHNFVEQINAKVRTKGYPISKTEKFVNE